MTTSRSTATTAASESREPKLNDFVHYVPAAGTCSSSVVTAVEYLNPDDYTRGEEDEGYKLDVELAYVALTVFAPGSNPTVTNRSAHSPLPTPLTYHYAEECRRGK